MGLVGDKGSTLPFGLAASSTPGAQVIQSGEKTWRLEIPAGPRGKYRLAQLDDYGKRGRRAFPWRPPVHFSVRARASTSMIPGTWGLGLWNDPFGMALLTGAEMVRLPALPNAAWFFFASPPNHLSFYNDQPGHGRLAAVFSAPPLPAWALAPGLPLLPLSLFRLGGRFLRRLARGVVRQASLDMAIDPTAWHAYSLRWQAQRVSFAVDGEMVLETSISPRPPLGLVVWVDNQYAAARPEGSFGMGTLASSQPAWIEINELSIDVPSL